MAEKLRLEVLLAAVDKISGPLRNIATGSKATAQAVGATELAIKKMQAQQQMLQRLQNAAPAVNRQRQVLRVMKEELALMQKSGQASTKQIADQERAITKQTAAYERQRAAVMRLRSDVSALGLGKASQAQATLATSIASANAQIDAQRRKMEQQRKVEERLVALKEKHAKSMKHGAMVTAAGAGGLYAGQRMASRSFESMKAGADFEQTLSKVQALTGLDKASEQMQAIRMQARRLGAETMFSATQAAEGQAFLGMAGFKPDQIMAAMPGVLDMAKAGDLEIARAADISSNILQAFRMQAEEMGRVSDVLTKGFTSSNVTLEMLGNTMTYVAPIATEFGASIEDATAMAGLLGNAGIQGEKAGTALRSAFTRLAKPPKDAAKALDALGVKTMDSAGNMRPMVEILGEVAKRTEKLGNGKRLGIIAEIFGLEAASGGASLLKEASGGNIEKYTDILKNSQGAAAKTAKTMADNWRGSMDEMSSAWDDVKIGLFEQNADSLRALTDTVTEKIRAVGSFLSQNPMLGKAIFWAAISVTALTTAVGALLVPVGLFLAKGFLLRFLLARLGLSFAGMALAGGKAGGVMGLLARSGGAVASMWGLAGRAVGGALGWFTRIAQWVGSLSAYIPTVLRFGATFARLLGPIGLVITAATMLYQRWDDVVGGAKLLWEDLTSAIGSGLQAVMGLTSQFFNAGANIIQGLVSGITSRIAAVRDAVGEVASSSIGWFKEKLGIHSPSRVFAELGGYVGEGAAQGITGSSSLVRNAALGMAAATLVPMGAMALPMGGMLPMPDMASMAAAAPAGGAAGGGGASSYVINITVQGNAKGDEIGAAVRAEIERIERQKAARRGSSLTDID